METIDLRVESREHLGKGASRAARRQGKVPAILYGPHRVSTALILDAKEFETGVGGLWGSQLIRLQSAMADIGGRLVLVKEVQRHPVTQTIVHADLYEVDVDTEIHVPVPLRFVGHAQGVEDGGILQPVRREVDVLCLPTEIPEFLEIDVSGLGINDALHVRDLKPLPRVKVHLDTDVTLVTVLPPVIEEAPAAAAGEVEGAPAEEGAAEEAAEATKEPPAKEET